MNATQSRVLAHHSSGLQIRRGAAFGLILIAALIAFELFNYSTTDYALGDLLGKLTFAGVRWSTILALAFCGIDFAGIARLFTPEQGSHEPSEVWYLFGAWLLAATMNAMLTWWGVSMAVLNHRVESTTVISSDLLLKVVPVFVAVMVWLIRILIIGSLSYAGEKLFTPAERERTAIPVTRSPMAVRPGTARPSMARPSSSAPAVPAPVARAMAVETAPAPRVSMARPMASRPGPRPEPTYHNMSAQSYPAEMGAQETRR